MTDSSSEPASSESEPSTSEPVEVSEYTAEGIIQDICTNLFDSAILDEDYFSDGADGFYTGVGFGNYGSDYLKIAVTTVVNYLPEYCVEISSATAGTWDDGEDGYFATYASDDYCFGISIGSYIYNSNLCAQVNVYPVAE